MNDDLNLLISFLTTDNTFAKAAVCIPHGMNNRLFDDYTYYYEPEVQRRLKGVMNEHVQTFCKRILAVETIFDIKGK